MTPRSARDPTPIVRTLPTAQTSAALREQIRALLHAAFCGGFSDEDWQHSLGGWHAVVTDGPALVAHAALVPRTLEVAGRPLRTGYVEGVATAVSRRGEGHGSRAMRALAHVLRQELQMGALSTDRHSFYERLGWERWQGPTFVRQGPALLRSAEEDGGVMVLRFGDSAGVDLRAAIASPARSGDDW